MAVQLAVVDQVLTQEAQHDLGDGQADVGQGTLLFDTGADFSQIGLDVLTGQEFRPFLHGHLVENFAASIHRDFYLSFFRCFDRLNVNGVGVLGCLFGGKFRLQPFDFALQGNLALFVAGFLRVKSGNHFIQSVPLFLRGFLGHIFDGGGKFRLTGFEFVILHGKGSQFLALAVQALLNQQRFQCHGSALLSVWFSMRPALWSVQHPVPCFWQQCWFPGMQGMCRPTPRTGLPP